MNQLSWNQKPFMSIIDLRSKNKPIGKVVTSTYLKQASEIFGKKFRLVCKGVLCKNVHIINPEDKIWMAEIKYQYFSNRASIKLNSGENLFWHCKLSFSDGWSISDPEDKVMVKCLGFIKKGTIIFHESSEILILSGLFLASQYLRSLLLLALIVITVSMQVLKS